MPSRAMLMTGRTLLSQNFADQHPFDQGDFDIRDEKLAPWPRTPEIVWEDLAAYYAMITHLCDQVGTVFQSIKASGKATNTIVVFAEDNGFSVGQHGLLGKQNTYKHSVRVPLPLGFRVQVSLRGRNSRRSLI
jgi:arylsulfatase A-like enzyme